MVLRAYYSADLGWHTGELCTSGDDVSRVPEPSNTYLTILSRPMYKSSEACTKRASS